MAGTDDTDAASGWLFTGRADLMRELIATARGDRDHLSLVTLVTGGAGCGKSAVLARLVTLSDPAFVAAHPDRVAAIPADLKPPPDGGVDVAVVATAKYAHEIVGQLSDALRVRRPDSGRGDAGLEERIRVLLAALTARPDPVTVVVDALDEAQDPPGVARALGRLTSSHRLRLVVGVRSPSGPDDPLAAAGAHGSFADQTERRLRARRLRVDEDPWWHQRDVAAYATSILANTPGSPTPSPRTTDRAGTWRRRSRPGWDGHFW